MVSYNKEETQVKDPKAIIFPKRDENEEWKGIKIRNYIILQYPYNI